MTTENHDLRTDLLVLVFLDEIGHICGEVVVSFLVDRVPEEPVSPHILLFCVRMVDHVPSQKLDSLFYGIVALAFPRRVEEFIEHTKQLSVLVVDFGHLLLVGR
jgi:hypothetical protein